MTKENTIEGIVTQTKGKKDCIGNRISVIRKIDTCNFKEEIIVTGEDGFRGYPSEELYIQLYNLLVQGHIIEGRISDIKKDGVCNALFFTYN